MESDIYRNRRRRLYLAVAACIIVLLGLLAWAANVGNWGGLQRLTVTLAGLVFAVIAIAGLVQLVRDFQNSRTPQDDSQQMGRGS